MKCKNPMFSLERERRITDGKLNTLVKDPSGRNRKVLEIFVKEGAPEEILYVNKPHTGTDLLMNVVKNMRKTIQSNGGEVRFESKVTELCITDGKICGVVINKEQFLPAKIGDIGNWTQCERYL